MKKCIYCNSNKNLTTSDIIPDCITKAKFKNNNVCKTHNNLTNFNFERDFSNNFSFLRNKLFFLNRRIPKKLIPFKADIYFKDELMMKNYSFTCERDFCKKHYQFNEKFEIIKLINVPPKFQNLKGIKINDIKYKSLSDHNLLFFSETTLRTVLKICYEFHCKNNNINEKKDRYNPVINCLLNGKSALPFVEVINDPFFEHEQITSFGFAPGSHGLLECINGGKRIVIFSLYGLVWYKVFICDDFISDFEKETLFQFQLDKTSKRKRSNMFCIEGNINSLDVNLKENFFLFPSSISIETAKLDKNFNKSINEKLCSLVNGAILTIESLKQYRTYLKDLNFEKWDKRDFYETHLFAENKKILSINLFYSIAKISTIPKKDIDFLKLLNAKYLEIFSSNNDLLTFAYQNYDLFKQEVLKGMNIFSKLKF